MSKQKILYETKRTYIRPFERLDFTEFLKMHQNPKIMANFFSGVKSLLQAKQKFDFILEHHKLHGFSYSPVFRKENNEYIGQTGIVLNPDNSVNLCFLFKEEFWGRGYATETTRGTIKYCFETLNLPKIKAMTTIQNKASRKVLDNCGFKFIEEKPVEKFIIAFYELTKQEYFANQKI
jgi:[ribosomal protein S5]-alanine N-acetyltransferase